MNHIRIIQFCFLHFVLSFSSYSQVRTFLRLSKPERIWVMKHPLIAKRVFRMAKKTLVECSNNQIKNSLDTFANGGKLDAFRHIYWMSTLTQSIGSKRAFSLGLAHEKSNYLQFIEHQLEDKELPDYPSCMMDSLNNLIGIELGISWRKSNRLGSELDAVELINSGNCFVIKRDTFGNYLTCDDKLILSEMLHKWKNEKCVIKLSEVIK